MVNYPQMIVNKPTGNTDSERYLSRVCNDTFLSLWTYPSPTKADGKELCDLLVVFRNSVIIFSDKDCEFKNEVNIEIAWGRWYKKAIIKSANQLYGAEREIIRNPDEVFLDKKKQTPFPLTIPQKEEIIIYRVAVARGAKDACIKYHDGGSGSLMMLHTDGEAPSRPFTICNSDFTKGFVHVFDETTFDIVLKTLDTITDFIDYLDKKEKFFADCEYLSYCGEEDLLAQYLCNLDEKEKHCFIANPEIQPKYRVHIEEGIWAEFRRKLQYGFQVPENNISYLWDTIIERFAYHIMNGTSRVVSNPDVASQSRIFSYLANESRLRRRNLAKSLIGILSKPAHKKNASDSVVKQRVVFPTSEGDPLYTFVVVGRTTNQSDDEYREHRMRYLEAYVQRTKLETAKDKSVIGIAISNQYPEDSSEDIVLIDADNWDDEYKAEAEETVKTFREAGMWNSKREFSHYTDYEYPSGSPQIKTYKGRDRNKPCPCGSGKKLKNCCLRSAL